MFPDIKLHKNQSGNVQRLVTPEIYSGLGPDLQKLLPQAAHVHVLSLTHLTPWTRKDRRDDETHFPDTDDP